jgi:hypothetical protein
MSKPRPSNSLPFPILRLRRQKRKLFSTRHSDPERYRLAARKCARATRSHFASVEESLVSSGSMKSFYDHVRRRTKGDDGDPDLCVNGRLVSDPSTKANLFSDYFASVFTRDDGTLCRLPLRSPYPLTSVHISPSLLSNVMRTVKSKLSRGPDGVPSLVLKQLLLDLLLRRVLCS